MAFLKNELKEKEPVASHEILKEHPLSLNEKIAYFQGCVLATLLDDARISQEERRQIFKLGRSLLLSDEDIAESIETVEGLTSEREQDLFLNELKSALSERPVLKYFMVDFERLMQKPKGMNADAEKDLNYVGNRLVGSSDWRAVLRGGEEVCPGYGNVGCNRGKCVDEMGGLDRRREDQRKAVDGFPSKQEWRGAANGSQTVVQTDFARPKSMVDAMPNWAVFENESVKRLYSEWERLCGAYCRALPALTYQLQDAGRRCVRGIVLPQSCLKDVVLKFISGSVSPSFQGRGEAEWVKDRGAVLGILLLHYIGSPDFNPYGEEAEDLRQIYQLAQRQPIQDRLVEHIHKYLEIDYRLS